MMMKTMMVWAALAALAGASAASGQDWGDEDSHSAASSKTSQAIQLRVCNRSGDDALVAVSYIPVGESRFVNRGWFPVGAGECGDIAQTNNSNFYFYADVVDQDSHWGGSHSLCVEYPGPYDFYTAGSDYCDSGQETRDFVSASRQEPGTFTWDLDP